MKKRFLAFIMAVLLMLVSLVGCGDSKTSSNDLEEFSIVLDWYPNAIHSFIYNAIEKGYYAEEGLDVKVYFPSNVNDAISLPAVGKADVGIYYPNDVIRGVANEDIPVKIVGNVAQSSLNILSSLKSKNIVSPEDLKGKIIGYSGNEFDEILVKTMLENVGLSTNDVELIDVGFDLMTAMTTERVDATIGCMVNHEIPSMEEQGFEMNYFFPAEYGAPEYPELVFVAGDKLIEENRDKLERFLRASKKGFEDMKNNPDESIKILMENQNAENFPLTESVEKESMEVLLPIMETENLSFLAQDMEAWQKDVDWLKSEGLIDRDLSVSDFAVEIIK